MWLDRTKLRSVFGVTLLLYERMGACGVGIGTVMRSRGVVSRAPIGSSGHRGGTTEQNGCTERGWTGQDRIGQDRTG